jgi:hypothetical protein
MSGNQEDELGKEVARKTQGGGKDETKAREGKQEERCSLSPSV